MPTVTNAGDLYRVKSIELNSDWPSHIVIAAVWSKDGTKRGKRKSITINADQFFGINGYGAPMSGSQLIDMVDRLRRQK